MALFLGEYLCVFMEHLGFGVDIEMNIKHNVSFKIFFYKLQCFSDSHS